MNNMNNSKNSDTKQEKLPSFQFYPGDWNKDPGIRALTYEERGIWFQLLLLMHESSERGVLLLNGKAMPDDAIAICLGLDNQKTTTTLTKIEAYGVAHRRPSDGALYNKRMVRDEELRKIRKKAGKQGGNPILLNQIPTTQVNQIPTPSSSSSLSSLSDLSDLHSSNKDLCSVLDLSDPDPIKHNGTSITKDSVSARSVELAPRIRITPAEHESMLAEFGAASIGYYAPTASDWLISRGKTMKNYAAFLRNWIRRDIAECRGFYHPSKNGASRKSISEVQIERHMETLNKILAEEAAENGKK